MKNGKL